MASGTQEAAFAAQLLQQSIAAAIESMAPQGTTEGSTKGYLQGTIYPTLVPAMEELVREVERCHEEGREPPQALDWIASYLMRHNLATIPVEIPADAPTVEGGEE